MTPRFTHDCKKCLFRGRDGEFDMYWCQKEHSSHANGGSIIARSSSDAPDYQSGPVIQYLTTTIKESQVPVDAAHNALVRAAKKLLTERRIMLVTMPDDPTDDH